MTIIVTPIDTTPVSEFVREVMPFAPNAPDFEVEFRLKQALRDFCRRTNCWRQRNTALLTTVMGQEDYPAGLPVGTELAAVLAAWIDRTELEVLQTGDEEDFAPGDMADYPGIMRGAGDVVRLAPPPSSSGRPCTGTISLAPNEASETVPSFIFYEWRNAIREGCLGILLLEVGKPWSNPQQALLHAGHFDDYCRQASAHYGPVRRTGLRTRVW